MSIIIAEAGVNHNGDLNNAKLLASKAKEAGADYVKFQTFSPEKLVSVYARKAEYQKKTTASDESQLQMLKRLSLTYNEFTELKEYCDKIKMKFLTAPFDIESVRFTDGFVELWKIPSGEITNLPYLIEIAKTKKPVIMSTGMADLSEIDEAIGVLKEYGTKEITLLHCTTEYPAPFGEVNLSAMETLKKEFGLPVGYSDHTKGIEIPIAAAALGAVVIEKHFTLDKNMDGPDHKASLEPGELSAMVNAIRNVEISLGSSEKKPTVSERKNMSVARKSIVASRLIKKGEIFTEDNITTKRPGNGISPMKWFDVIGKKAIKDFEEDELILCEVE